MLYCVLGVLSNIKLSKKHAIILWRDPINPIIIATFRLPISVSSGVLKLVSGRPAVTLHVTLCHA